MATTLESWDTMTQPQQARRRAFTVGAAVLAGLVIAVVLVIKLWPDGGSPSRGIAKGPDVTWRAAADGVRLPVSDVSGPKRFVDGRGLEFARTKAGAALAAIHISHDAGASPGPAIFTPTIRDQVVGADRDAMLRETSGQYEADRAKFGLPEGAAIPTSNAARISYLVTRYTDSDAAVTVASAVGADANKFFAVDLEVQWINGDWRLVAPKGGFFGNVFRELAMPPAGSVVLEVPNR